MSQSLHIVLLGIIYSTLTKRQSLDRRRFESAHLRYAILREAASYSEQLSIKDLLIFSDIEKTLQIVTPILYNAFQARFSGKTVAQH